MIFQGRKKFLETVNKLSDTTVLYDKNNIVIIEVKSFNDCKELFDKKEISWCIAKHEDHWNSYVKSSEFSHQYFLIDFNSINGKGLNTQNNSLIGFTLVNGKLTAAHAKDDKNLLSSYEKENNGYHPFERILKDKGVYRFVKHNLNSGMKENAIAWIVTIGFLALIISGVCWGCWAIKHYFIN